MALDGATAHPFATLDEGARALAAALADPDGPRYAHLYWDEVDTTGHLHGPSSAAFAEASVRALDALEDAFFGARPPRPSATPSCSSPPTTARSTSTPAASTTSTSCGRPWRDHLAPLHPAGSARDLFLHVREGHVDAVVEGLAAALGDRAEVRRAAELFPGAGPRLRERLADVCVLPAPGRMAWLRSAAGVEQRFRGHHGGLDPAETGTYLASVPLG